MLALLPYFAPLLFAVGFAVGRSPVIPRRPHGGSTAQAPAFGNGNRATAERARTFTECSPDGPQLAAAVTLATAPAANRTIAPGVYTVATAGHPGAAKPPLDAA